MPELTLIPKKWLKSYRRSLARYHLHLAAMFLGGNFDERGIMRRRHVKVFGFQQIGKEVDHLEEREYLGDSSDNAIEHSLTRRSDDRERIYRHRYDASSVPTLIE